MPPRHVLLESESPTPPSPIIVFDLRRHLNPTASRNVEKLYLTAKEVMFVEP